MKVRAIWGRHGGDWHFYETDLPASTTNHHYMIEDCPEELYDEYKRTRKEFLAATHAIAQLIPTKERHAIVTVERWTPAPRSMKN